MLIDTDNGYVINIFFPATQPNHHDTKAQRTGTCGGFFVHSATRRGVRSPRCFRNNTKTFTMALEKSARGCEVGRSRQRLRWSLMVQIHGTQDRKNETNRRLIENEAWKLYNSFLKEIINGLFGKWNHFQMVKKEKWKVTFTQCPQSKFEFNITSQFSRILW